MLKVSGRPADLPDVLAAARDAGGSVVGRAALGLSWLALEGDDVAEPGRGRPRRARAARVRGARRPETVRTAVATWGEPDPGALVVMGRVKERFDPARIFRPGSFVGGI